MHYAYVLMTPNGNIVLVDDDYKTHKEWEEKQNENGQYLIQSFSSYRDFSEEYL